MSAAVERSAPAPPRSFAHKPGVRPQGENQRPAAQHGAVGLRGSGSLGAVECHRGVVHAEGKANVPFDERLIAGARLGGEQMAEQRHSEVRIAGLGTRFGLQFDGAAHPSAGPPRYSPRKDRCQTAAY